jgi:dipeptidyl aminopeptidase/acylaminoacyl peptidase
MRRSIAILALAIAAVLSPAARPSPLHSAGRPIEDASALLPPGVIVEQFVPTADGRRTYFTSTSGELWLYSQADKTTTPLAAGPVWDLNVSPAGNALAYTKSGEGRRDQHVWMLFLDPATGLARSPERQIGMHPSDVPSISPDGKSIAFARDDPSGVGQTVVTAPIGGGAERVVAPRQPSNLANIRWTPDGKTLFFGVNPPVACVPAWSCLPLAPDLRDPLGAIDRVAATGGPVATVAIARRGRPGLSPDGRTLLYLDAVTPSARQWVVANADGTRRDTLTLPPSETPVGWWRGSVVLIETVATGTQDRADAPASLSIAAMDLAASR